MSSWASLAPALSSPPPVFGHELFEQVFIRGPVFHWNIEAGAYVLRELTRGPLAAPRRQIVAALEKHLHRLDLVWLEAMGAHGGRSPPGSGRAQVVAQSLLVHDHRTRGQIAQALVLR